MSTIQLPIYIPEWLVPPLRRIKRSVQGSAEGLADLSGDRDIEWSFIASHLPSGPGEALDFGCNGTYLSLIAALRGLSVIGLDLEVPTTLWSHPNRHFVQGDLEVGLEDGTFDVVINCSSVEHVGLAGRYGVATARQNGDIEAMRRLRKLMKPGAIQLLTVPLGRDAVFQPLHRVYGQKRLPELLRGYQVLHSEYWRKSQEGSWSNCEKREALTFDAAWDSRRKIYALGCFVLQPSALSAEPI